MKTKLFLLAIMAAGSMFAQTRFSVRIGVGNQGYYEPYAAYGPQRSYQPSYGGSYGYRGPSDDSWRYDAERAHKRAEWHSLKHHKMEERWQYGSSEELREHHIQERRALEHEQWHERHGDSNAAYGPGHRSAYDGDDRQH